MRILKRRILYILLILAALLITACEKEKNSIIKPVDADSIKKEYKDIAFDANATEVDGSIQLTITLENKSEEEVFLNKQDGENLFVLTAENKDGKILHTEVVQDAERKSILPKELVTWTRAFSVSEYGDIKIEVGTLLLENKMIDYDLNQDIVNLKVSIQPPAIVEKKPFIPNIQLRYIYETRNKENPERVEEFLFMETGYAQSRIIERGVTVYESTEEGLFAVRSGDPVGDINFIPVIKEEPKELILKLPAEIGQTWEKNNVTYTITSVDENVETPFKSFEGAIKVEIREKKNVWNSYYHEDYGLIKTDYVKKVYRNGEQEVRTDLVLKNVEMIHEIEGREISEELMY